MAPPESYTIASVANVSLSHENETKQKRNLNKSANLNLKSSLPAQSAKNGRVFSLAQLKAECSMTGKCLIGFEGKVYDLSMWLPYHPGGDLAISHLVGKDATDQIRAFHPPYVWETMIARYYYGDLIWSEVELLANEDSMKITTSFNALRESLINAGMFEPNHFNYVFMMFRFLVHFSLAVLLCLYIPAPLNGLVGGAAIASFWQQIAFFSHDAGHSGVSQNRKIDSLMGTMMATFFGGLSLGWWKHSHNVHHIITNHPEHDPDIQHMPVFAVSKTFCNNLFSTYHGKTMVFDALARWFVSMQYYSYLPICTIGRFNLYVLSYSHLYENYLQMDYGAMEVVGLCTFWIWYLSLCLQFNSPAQAVIFILASHIFSSILHLQINVSHYGMSTDALDCDEHFAARALRTSMDVDCPKWFDWFHGGLQFQVIHHLFPRMPRHNLRKCVPLVRQFCAENGLAYHCHGFVKGNIMVLQALKEVADHVQFLLSTATVTHHH